MDSVKECYISYKSMANQLGIDWEKVTIRQLADGYCDSDESNDSFGRNKFFSALMCRYWYMVNYLESASRSCNLPTEDFIFWVSEALLKGLKYRRWRDESNPISKEDDIVNKIFNRCFYSIRNYHYRELNHNNRKVFKSTSSMEESIENCGDGAECMNVESTYSIKHDSMAEIIKKLVKKNKYFEAFIIDEICYDDTFSAKDGSFSFRLIRRNVKGIDDSYAKYFSNRYGVDYNDVVNNLLPIVDLAENNNRTFGKRVKKLLEVLSNNEEVMSVLC